MGQSLMCEQCLNVNMQPLGDNQRIDNISAAKDREIADDEVRLSLSNVPGAPRQKFVKPLLQDLDHYFQKHADANGLLPARDLSRIWQGNAIKKCGKLTERDKLCIQNCIHIYYNCFDVDPLDGKVNYVEFMTFMLGGLHSRGAFGSLHKKLQNALRVDPTALHRVYAAFESADLDKSGVLDLAELMTATKRLDETCDPLVAAEQLLEEMDIDGDGKVDYYEFLSYSLGRRKTPVELIMYDISYGISKHFSMILLGRQFEAIYHTGVHVFGYEYWFGGQLFQNEPPMSRIFGDPLDKSKVGAEPEPQPAEKGGLAEGQEIDRQKRARQYDDLLPYWRVACATIAKIRTQDPSQRLAHHQGRHVLQKKRNTEVGLELSQYPDAAEKKLMVYRLGYTLATREEALRYLNATLSTKYTRDNYDVLNNNCNSFSDEFVFFLTGNHIPEAVRLLPELAMNAPIARLMRPLLNRYLGGFGSPEQMVDEDGSPIEHHDSVNQSTLEEISREMLSRSSEVSVAESMIQITPAKLYIENSVPANTNTDHTLAQVIRAYEKEDSPGEILMDLRWFNPISAEFVLEIGIAKSVIKQAIVESDDEGFRRESAIALAGLLAMHHQDDDTWRESVGSRISAEGVKDAEEVRSLREDLSSRISLSMMRGFSSLRESASSTTGTLSPRSSKPRGMASLAETPKAREKSETPKAQEKPGTPKVQDNTTDEHPIQAV
eukprot:GEMP01010542.1.p1 GENE.GEMP01010542.1~~GEMP01010542.1.p1  ORF type:complete len:734 (+),score=126.84 GEMP01010542.1:48-2204(+)